MLVSEEAAMDEIRAIKTFVEEQRALESPFDIVMEADTRGDTPEQTGAKARGWADAGVTWWVESMWAPASNLVDVQTRIRQGPPRGDAE